MPSKMPPHPEVLCAAKPRRTHRNCPQIPLSNTDLTAIPAHIRALVSVFPNVAFCPTGGVEPGNLDAYLAAGAAFVGMGGALVDEKRIAAGDRAAIEAAAKAILA